MSMGVFATAGKTLFVVLYVPVRNGSEWFSTLGVGTFVFLGILFVKVVQLLLNGIVRAAFYEEIDSNGKSRKDDEDAYRLVYAGNESDEHTQHRQDAL